MKKNLKSCIEPIEEGNARILLDMNRYEAIEQSGAIPDLHHKKSVHMTAAWHFSEHSQIRFAGAAWDLTPYRYLTFSVFSVRGAGGSFSLMFDSEKDGKHQNGYEVTLPITKDGWNDFRIELPFMRTVGTPLGWGQIGSICFDCVVGGQCNRSDTVLYIDNLLVWEGVAPPLYVSMPELKGAAVFSRTGNFSIVDRKRIANTADGAEAKPFEHAGIFWLPMAPVAAGIAHSAVVDNRAFTLSFTYRRKKYAFSGEQNYMTVGEEKVPLGFSPAVVGGTLFFPADFVRTFFHWRQIFVDPMGLIVLSNRKNVFESARDAGLIEQLIFDCTFLRPNAERMLNDLHRRFPNPGRGRLLASFDQLMQLRRDAKTDSALKDYVERLKVDFGTQSAAFSAEPISDASNESALTEAADRVIAFAMLYRVTGDKKYAERVALECEALSAMADWSAGGSVATLGEVALGIAIGYDWCHHVWSEGRKALLERAMLRNGMRPGLDAYDGKSYMWRAGSVSSCEINAGMLAMSLALADIYPQTVYKLLDRILRNMEPCFAAYAPDGGYAESVSAWQKSCRALALSVAMLQTACGTDYGFLSAPGFQTTAYFPLYTETANGAWNYHHASAENINTSMLFWFSRQTGEAVPAWMRRQQILSGRKAVHPFDILFYTAVDDALVPFLPLDAVYRKAGLAVMRSAWNADAMFVGLHGGKNHGVNADLDAGSVLLEMNGERFFVDTGKETVLPGLLARRAAGQNTVVVDPVSEPAPDQNPDAVAMLTEMRSAPERAYAVVDMTSTNDAILRAKRGVMLTNMRQVAVIQDEMTLAKPSDIVWTVWTRAEIKLNAGGRAATLTQNGQTLACKLCGVASPARFSVQAFENTDLKTLCIQITGKEKLRMAVVCRLLREGEKASQKVYEVVPMSKWCETED